MDNVKIVIVILIYYHHKPIDLRRLYPKILKQWKICTQTDREVVQLFSLLNFSMKTETFWIMPLSYSLHRIYFKNWLSTSWYLLWHCLLMQASLSGQTVSLRQPTSHSRSSQICLGPHLESLLQTVLQSPPRHRSSARQFWSLKLKQVMLYLE
jgi:hypothetical protein